MTELSLLGLVIELGGGMVPTEGVFTATVWARLLGVKEATFRRWVTRYAIPHRKPGAEMLIDARDFLAAVPYQAGEA